MMPQGLHLIAILSLLVGFFSTAVILIDVTRHPQHMAIMNVVWPVTGLYAGPIALWAYFRYGRPAKDAHTPFSVMVGTGTTHCGAGCTLGDIVAEWLAFSVPTIAVWFGWQSIFAEKIFAIWILDFIFAFGFGIVFQYFAIAPMRGLGFRDGIIAALKADTLSLTAWQAGMYAFMAFAQLYLFGHILGRQAPVNSVEFWFTMQIAMIAGFITSYPVNWWLIEAGIKEKM
jgi:hypothetical protein